VGDEETIALDIDILPSEPRSSPGASPSAPRTEGEVRSGSVKRVAAAVREGSQVVATLHAFFGTRQ
jgi:hypothetical protein